MSIIDEIVLDQDVTIEELVTGAPRVDQFITHEDGLRVDAGAAVQNIIPDHHVPRGRDRIRGPELDHVPMIAKTLSGHEIMEMIILDQNIFDRRETKPVNPDIMELVVSNNHIRAEPDRGGVDRVCELIPLEHDPVCV